MIFTNYPYLQDKDFLKEFDSITVREQYVKVIALDFLKKSRFKSCRGE